MELNADEIVKTLNHMVACSDQSKHFLQSTATLIEQQQNRISESQRTIDSLKRSLESKQRVIDGLKNATSLGKIEQQQKEIADLKTKLTYAEDAAAKGDLARLNASGMEMEIEELQEDKERLDWVQNNSIQLSCNRTGQWLALSPMFPEPSELAGKGNSIRQAIDAAMQETKANP